MCGENAVKCAGRIEKCMYRKRGSQNRRVAKGNKKGEGMI
jgi:hypothetical protein